MRNQRTIYTALRIHMNTATVVIVMLLAGCDYGHKQFRPSSEAASLPGPLVVEVDDYGRFWDREAADAALKTIADASEDQNTIVSVFIHGWHHNADQSDDNFRNFQTSLERLRVKLQEPQYVTARRELGLEERVNVIGLYVGWRGRSLPGWLNYVTFWGRKSAAERVGDGDLREFFVKLQKVYMRRNNDASKPTFMGLLTIGHSFGGQVLFKAIAGAFERDLLNAAANAQAGSTGPPKLMEIVSGLGDMTVLLNPALEAFQYERIDRLTRGVSFMDIQAPVLLTVSAEDDSARKYWFPIARNLNVLFRPKFRSDELKELWTTALGEYEPQLTHELEASNGTLPPKESVSTVCKIVKQDLTGRPVVSGGAELSPKTSGEYSYSPVVIAHTSNDLVQEHNGIFGKNFGDFLIDYVGFVQGKRMCLIRGRS
ncbi:MAG: hypothetical protein K0S58_3502 [Nitrospira sp.]|nr:hypothetical protein [Nitrospira sp.]